MTNTIPTAAALVEAGRELFGRHGYDGTSVRSLTRRAGANLGAVTYHFGSKEALYRAVLARGLEPLAAGVTEIAGQPGDALDRLEWVIRLCCSYLAENRDVPSLLVRQVAAGEDLPEPARGAVSRIEAVLAGIITDGQGAGEIRAGDPHLLARSVLAEPLVRSLGWLRSPAAHGAESGAGEPSSDALDEHAVEFALAALREPSPDRRTGGGRRRQRR